MSLTATESAFVARRYQLRRVADARIAALA